MNKYQIALNSFVECANEKTCGIITYESIFGEYESIEIMKKSLQELVDRETPMKPVKGTLCGKCNSFLVINGVRYLRCLNINCEQKVDWGKDEEDQSH